VSDLRRPLGAILAADIISTAGSEMTSVALPWLVLTTTGSPILTSGVLAAEFAGLSLLGLVGGRVAATLGARRMMITADAVRAVLIGLVPPLFAIGHLPYVALLGVAFAVGSFFPAYSSSQRLVAAGLLGDDEVRLTRFGGLNNAVNETASFLGPALGGVLVAALGAPNVLLVDAASYLCAMGLIASLVPRTATHGPSTEEGRSIRAGLRYLVSHRALRREVLGIGVLEIGFTGLIATLPVLALRSAGGPSAAGWLLGAFGAGSIVGGLISTRAGSSDWRPVAVWGIAAPAVALLLPGPLWIMGILIGLYGVSVGLYFPRFFAALTARTPVDLRPVVMTAVTVAISAPGPVGFVAAGVLNQYAPGRAAGLILVAAAATAGSAIVASALRREDGRLSG
jgi:predicted MFS family arabinose efflux permease